MNALGSLWLAGVRPDWPALYPGERRRRVSLPTYPFERKRYALDVPADPAAASMQVTPVVDQRSNQAAAGSTPMQEEVSVTSTPNVPLSSVPEPIASTRPARVRALLVEVFEGLSGQDLSTVDGATTFLEMGFDSLFLTQVAQALHERLNLKVTFRQLLGDQSSLEALSAYVDERLPQDALAAPPQPAPSASAASPTPQALAQTMPAALPVAPVATAGGPESAVERLMREQLQAMNQLFASQLAALGGGVSAPAAPATLQTPQPTVPRPAVPPPV